MLSGRLIISHVIALLWNERFCRLQSIVKMAPTIRWTVFVWLNMIRVSDENSSVQIHITRNSTYPSVDLSLLTAFYMESRFVERKRAKMKILKYQILTSDVNIQQRRWIFIFLFVDILLYFKIFIRIIQQKPRTSWILKTFSFLFNLL